MKKSCPKSAPFSAKGIRLAFSLLLTCTLAISYAQSVPCNVSQEPADEPPITLSQLNTIISAPGFYDPGHRYTDQLGTRGGGFSAGFLDTWLGETQILFPYNNLPVRVNLTDTQIVADNSNYMYWMTLAMGQEYFNVDMQWMMGVGAKETFTGTPWAGPPFNTNADGAYGPFEVELFTGVDRALSIPSFFPEYAAQLASGQDINTSGIVPLNFMNDYIGANPTELDEAPVVNAYVLSITNFFNLYNWYSYAEDLCWHKVIDNPADKYYALGAMTVAYNLGVFSADPIALTMNKDNFKNTLSDPNAQDLLPEGNNRYRVHITEVVETIEARAQAATNPTTPLWDYQIEWPMVERFFLGEGGTVASQGQGGLLKHFEVANTGLRQQIMDTLMQAFDTMKGKAPSSTSSTISFRYDWLTLLRTVKQHFPNQSFYNRPTKGDANLRINAFSNVGGCCNQDPEIVLDLKCLNERSSFELNKVVDAVTWTLSDAMGNTLFTSSNDMDGYVFTLAGDYTLEAVATEGATVTTLQENIIFDNTLPDASNVQDYEICFVAGGNAEFDLRLKTDEVIANNPNLTGIDVTYHLTQQDAQDRSNPLQNIDSYTFSGMQQELFLAASANGNNCVSVGSFMLSKDEIQLIIEDEYDLCPNGGTSASSPTVDLMLNGFDSYEWKNLDNGNTISTQSSISITQKGSYSITITKNTGGNTCEITKTFAVLDNCTTPQDNNDDPVDTPPDDPDPVIISQDNKDLVIPNFFTPNGDGSNDTWRISDPENILARNAKIFIFDRYGKLLKDLDPLSVGWDGEYGGTVMPATDYWYLVDYTNNGKRTTKRGHFTLKR